MKIYLKYIPYFTARKYLIFFWCFFVFGCDTKDTKNETSSFPDSEMDSLKIMNEIISNNPKDASILISRSRLLYHRNLFDAALKDVSNAIKLDSTHQKWYLLKSAIEMDYFRSMESINTLKLAVRKWPEDTNLRKKLSEAYLIVKQYDEAIDNTQELLQFNPQSSDAYTLLGIIAREQKDTIKAIDYFSEAVQLDADQLEAWVELANLQTGRNNKLATEYYQSALQIAPENQNLLHSYALFLQENNELQEAKNVYDQIIKTSPDYTNAYYNKGLILMDQDSFELAEKTFNTLIELNQENPKHFFYRGICHEMTGDFESALNDYTKTQSLNPQLPNIGNAIQSVRGKLGN